MKYIIDIESNGLLQDGLDYTSLPYRLKDTYKIWCVVLRHVDTGAVKTFSGNELTRENLQHSLRKCTELVGHNIVQFDLPVLMLSGLLDYEIGYPDSPSTLYGRSVTITDTLLWSKLLSPDRLGGHSLKSWGKRLGDYKGDFNDWSKFSQEMLEYCVQDTKVNSSILSALIKEQGTHDWFRSYSMEIKLADLTLKQELLGFDFDIELAQKNLDFLNTRMAEIAVKVNPLLPPKKMSAVDASFFELPKLRFKKDGTLSANLEKFLAKTGAVFTEQRTIRYENKEYPIDYSLPLRTHEEATIENIDVVKGYLISLGWIPTEVKERDLMKNTDKSVKNYQQAIEAIDRYVKQTESSVFKDLRLELLDVSLKDLKQFLINKMEGTKPVYIPTTPKLTVGLEKEICPNLVSLGEKAEFVKDVVEYYTYRHRRNAIAGGELDEDGEPITGFLSCVREDGRIPTPADTLGANTGRYRHKVVCNIPRNTSLFGTEMRSMFRSGKLGHQLGYDFASLEARIEGHYVLPYTGGEELAKALLAVKPNDIHSLTAQKMGISRDHAKSVNYAVLYGAQAAKLVKMLNVSPKEAKRIYNSFWDANPALKELKEKIEAHWLTYDKKFITGLDGRLVSTRSKHSLLNVLFQSGGAIAAKWSAVRLAGKMEARGILGNPFVNSATDAVVWWLIHMHDEQQMAAHPKLLELKLFKTEDEAKTYRTDTSGAIGHSSKGYYVTNRTLPIDCIAEGIEQASKELGLRVPLGFEYITGRNWGQCH
jgi:hypothetical protein